MNRAKNTGKPGEIAPTRAGSDPRRMRAIAPRACAAVALTAVAITFGGGCANNDDNQVNSPTEVGMTDQMAPFYQDQQLTLYEAQIPVQLPIRQATPAELSALGPMAPYPHAPYLSSSDERVEIRFTISNIDDKSHNIELLIDPWNEFDRYKPGIQVVSDEESTPDLSGYDRYFVVPAKSRVQGTISADDTHEMEMDLATAEAITAGTPALGQDVSGNALMNHAMNLHNQSSQPDPLIQPWIQKGNVPGLTGFDLGIRTTEQANVAVEITVDITDLNGNRLIPQGENEPNIGLPPNELVPPKAPAMD